MSSDQHDAPITNTASGNNDKSLSKRAVYIMNATNGLYVHPIHYHSFTAVGSSSIFAPAAGVSLLSAPKCLFVGTFHKCAACHNRLGSLPRATGRGETSHEECSSGMEMLHCVACGVYAHRSCAFARSPIGTAEVVDISDGVMPVCEVNCSIVKSALELRGRQQTKHIPEPDGEVPSLTNSPKSKTSWSFFGRRALDENASNSCPTSTKEVTPLEQGAHNCVIGVTADENSLNNEPAKASSPEDSKTSWSIFKRSKETIECKDNEIFHDDSIQQPSLINAHQQLQKNQIDASNPHSSSPKGKSSRWTFFGKGHADKVEAVDTRHAEISKDQPVSNASEMNRDSEHPKTWCPHISLAAPDSPVLWSRFGRKAAGGATKTDEIEVSASEQPAMAAVPANHNNNMSHDEDVSDEHDEIYHAYDNLEGKLSSDSPITADQTPSLVQPQGMLRTSIEVIRKTTQTTSNIPKAYSIGMVAGGAVGLAIAGPAGVIVGSQIGKTALAVGAAVDGGMSIGMLVMGLVAASKYSHKSKDHGKLELSGHDCTLVLVRPDIEVDPIWADYVAEARDSWEKINNSSQRSSWSSIGGLFSSETSEHTAEIRYHRDIDIITADGSELAMREKVLLLVNRILNDKMSLPGYVYRHLIRKCIVRGSTNGTSPEICERQMTPTRSCRADAHGVIKHVTATLLEVRTGLASSPNLTEMSACAVEVLVFGEMYDGVYQEMLQETDEQYKNLLLKVQELHSDCRSEYSGGNTKNESDLSESAISSLKMMSEAHTSVDKLFYAVQFLESVSAYFSATSEGNMDADALLKTVCQHIIAISQINLYAEVAFIENFSRDEQLLRGKEGYALITLQASLHYLSEVQELDRDLGPHGRY